MVDILQNPRGYNLGCILGEPIKIDRALQNGETFQMGRVRIHRVSCPGHTEYQMMMMVNLDGARVAFTGDNYLLGSGDGPMLRHNLIFATGLKTTVTEVDPYASRPRTDAHGPRPRQALHSAQR